MIHICFRDWNDQPRAKPPIPEHFLITPHAKIMTSTIRFLLSQSLQSHSADKHVRNCYSKIYMVREKHDIHVCKKLMWHLN